MLCGCAPGQKSLMAATEVASRGCDWLPTFQVVCRRVYHARRRVAQYQDPADSFSILCSVERTQGVAFLGKRREEGNERQALGLTEGKKKWRGSRKLKLLLHPHDLLSLPLVWLACPTPKTRWKHANSLRCCFRGANAMSMYAVNHHTHFRAPKSANSGIWAVNLAARFKRVVCMYITKVFWAQDLPPSPAPGPAELDNGKWPTSVCLSACGPSACRVSMRCV
ncbi:hypothetical protein QBC35DRAFT_171736 [Podospora australis]|uniref:Uncharacterized protein n=1 Tax=Podospora australis TaxID=1536484 RepID=A0AAN6WWY3_9PEZI|nr:hypothetical protein QBC35DRAFT_171736 [Podospora australis]